MGQIRLGSLNQTRGGMGSTTFASGLATLEFGWTKPGARANVGWPKFGLDSVDFGAMSREFGPVLARTGLQAEDAECPTSRSTSGTLR